jgi:hypothetical protein
MHPRNSTPRLICSEDYFEKHFIYGWCFFERKEAYCILHVLTSCLLFSAARYEANYGDATKWRSLCRSFKRVFVSARSCSAVKNRVWLLTSGSPGAPHKGIINASQSRRGAERIVSIKCNFGRVPNTKFWITASFGYFHSKCGSSFFNDIPQKTRARISFSKFGFGFHLPRFH